MKTRTTYLKMNVPARMDFVNITGRVAEAVRVILTGTWGARSGSRCRS